MQGVDLLPPERLEAEVEVRRLQFGEASIASLASSSFNEARADSPGKSGAPGNWSLQ